MKSHTSMLRLSGYLAGIYIMADDLGYADITPYGQQLIETPNIERLAAQGMLLTQ